MSWQLLEYDRPDKDELKRILGETNFYADHDLDDTIVQVLRRLKYEVETARDIGAQNQPDEFHYKRAFKTKRVLLTHDKDYLDNERFPLSQTNGVIIFNIDTDNTSEIARALEVVDVILAKISPILKEKKVLLNSDYSLTFIKRVWDGGDFSIEETRYRIDGNGKDVWIWEED
jgi:predicted nuclease of predicted toxin-antitoxin system